MNIFERKVYRIILGPVFVTEKGNWRILNNKEIYASVKKVKVKAVCGSYSTAALRHIVLLPE